QYRCSNPALTNNANQRFVSSRKRDGSALHTAAMQQQTGERKTNYMKFATKNMARVAVIMMIIAAASTLASAQLNSNAPTITLNATLNEAVTVNLSANTVNFSMTPGSATNNGSTGITATTNWS